MARAGSYKLYDDEITAIKKHLKDEQPAERTYSNRTRRWTNYWSHEQLERALRLEREELKVKALEGMRDDAKYFNSPEFREDVIAELIAEGMTRVMAEGRTRDQARLYAEAQRLNLM